MSNEKVVRVAINGFGRIGNLAFLAALKKEEVEVVAINDPFISADYMAYMVKYDTAHGRFDGEVSNKDEHTLVVNGKEIKIDRSKVRVSEMDKAYCELVNEILKNGVDIAMNKFN